MSDADQPRTNPPTPKMKDFAQSIAKKLGQSLSADVLLNFDACKAYLDANQSTGNQPSEKQLSFASSIALRKGVAVPPEALANGKELSKWIDANLR